MSEDQSLQDALEFFESFELDLNEYWEILEVQSIVDSRLRAGARTLSFLLGKHGLDGLREELDRLDLSEVGIVEFLETVRGLIVPEARLALQGAHPRFSRASAEVIKDIESQKQLMIAVATGGPRIDSVNEEYIERREVVAQDLHERGLQDPNPFSDLWKWYGKWSADIGGYQARREFVTDLYEGLLRVLREGGDPARQVEPTGWQRVDRAVGKIRLNLSRAQDEEDFQAIGLLCRETLLSVAQEVYVQGRHTPIDGVTPSTTDAKRMLEAFIAAELGGGENEDVRRYARAALGLANALTHKRTAEYRLAALCAEATVSVVNIVAIVFGHRRA